MNGDSVCLKIRDLVPQEMNWFSIRTYILFWVVWGGCILFSAGSILEILGPTVHLVTISEALHEPSAMQAGIWCDLLGLRLVTRRFRWSSVCILQNLTWSSRVFSLLQGQDTTAFHFYRRRWTSPCSTLVSGYCWWEKSCTSEFTSYPSCYYNRFGTCSGGFFPPDFWIIAGFLHILIGCQRL